MPKTQAQSIPNEHLLRNCFVIGVALVFVLISYLPSSNPPQTVSAQTAKPWVHSFTPLRTRYVTPNGGGSQNGTIGNPISFATAVSTYQPGDLHILRAGAYPLDSIFGGDWDLTKNCSSASPCVWKSFVSSTGQPERVDMPGSIFVTGDYHWFVGLNLGGKKAHEGHIQVRAGGVHAIHNIFEDAHNSTMKPWNEGPDQIMYGNVVSSITDNPDITANQYMYYTQNDFASNGWKYFIQNVVLGMTDPPAAYLVHAYTSGGFISGFHFEKNFFGDAPSSNIFQPASASPGYKLIWKENYMLDVASGSGRGLRLNGIGVMEVTNSYFARSNFVPEAYWGATGTHDPWIFTGNEIYNPPGGNHIQNFVTRGTSGTNGSHKLLNADVWDNNTYSSPFKAQLYCNGTNSGNRTLAQWRTSTDACRVTPASAVGFDINSTEVASPTVNKIVVTQSEYFCASCTFKDGDWGNIYIANWENASTDVVNISSVVGPNKQYVVRYAKDFYGTPAASGTCPSTGACNVSLPTKYSNAGSAGQFSLAYIITAQPNTGSTPQDTTPPIASNIQSTSITQNSATITWTTNEPADSNVDYGLTSSYGSSSGINSTLKTSHSMTLSSLTAGTLYHYRVTSKDAAGNLTSSADFTFTTLASSPPAPTCTAISGYASNCNGTTPVLSATKTNQTATTLSLGVTVSLPSSPINAIYNIGYWFSPSQNKWVPFTLSGTPYPNSTSFLTNNANTSLSLPISELGTSPAYIVVWDYSWNGSSWTGPSCIGGTPTGSPGCWRLVTVPTQ